MRDLLIDAMESYHIPVLLRESLDALVVDPHGCYVDVTFGGGGHSRAILDRLGEKGRLIGMDQDKDAQANVPSDARFTFIPSNFRYLQAQLRLYGIRKVDGILADLGVSSHQLDDERRGFTHRVASTLDMRMNQESELTAARILNTYPEKRLWKMLEMYGEVRNAKTLASAIVTARQQWSFDSNEQLISLLERMYIGDKHRYFSQVFQALRIEVNGEIDALKEMLEAAKSVLVPGGRLVVLTYHSLEDKLVKHFMKSGTFDGMPIQDAFGNIEKPFKVITKKPLLPSNDEIRQNSRARSAKLRIAEKN